MESIKLSKLLSERGVASRREAEGLIAEGRVTVNGEPARVEQRVTDADRVLVDGHGLPPQAPHVYYLLYKPKGYITGRDDPRGRPSVHEFVAHLEFKVEPVGRLDFDTEGALLFTNDGELAHKLTHPSTKVPKRYAAKVWKTPDDRDLTAIRNGKVFLDDGPTHPAKVRVIEQTDTENAWVEVTVTEGRNRLVRRMFEALGHPVSKLRRESFATVSIRDLERGQLRPLTSDEVRRLKDLAEGTRPASAGRVKRKAGHAVPKPKKKRLGRGGSRKRPQKSPERA